MVVRTAICMHTLKYLYIYEMFNILVKILYMYIYPLISYNPHYRQIGSFSCPVSLILFVDLGCRVEIFPVYL